MAICIALHTCNYCHMIWYQLYGMYIDICRRFINTKLRWKIAVTSSVTVVASILFFVVGFLCGNVYQKKRSIRHSGQTQIPYHDDVVLQKSEQELQLKKNVAYGPVQ